VKIVKIKKKIKSKVNGWEMSACGHMESEDRVGCTRVFRSSRSLLRHEILQGVPQAAQTRCLKIEKGENICNRTK